MTLPVAWLVSDFWHDQLVEHQRQWLFLVLVGLLLSFGFIRISARLMRSPRVPWWPGSVVSDSGVHLHHLVWGISLMMIAGTVSFAGFATDPIYEVCAFLFGVGMGLTIDEFALWVHLDDVYWAEEGRSSIDAAVILAAAILVVLLGVRPFDLETGSVEAIVGTAIGLLALVAVVMICALKGRLLHAVLGFFVGPIAVYGACRLGKPDSAWARRFYGERNPKKQQRAEQRFRPDRRTARFKKRFRDVIGGVPDAEYERRLQGPGEDG
jgi:hypothetical protein